MRKLITVQDRQLVVQDLIKELKTLMIETTLDQEDRQLQKALSYLSKAWRSYDRRVHPLRYRNVEEKKQEKEND